MNAASLWVRRAPRTLLIAPPSPLRSSSHRRTLAWGATRSFTPRTTSQKRVGLKSTTKYLPSKNRNQKVARRKLDFLERNCALICQHFASRRRRSWTEKMRISQIKRNCIFFFFFPTLTSHSSFVIR